MTRRIYLHIGAPKTGTTYLQDRLMLNTTSLAAHDVHLPTSSPLVSPALFHFRAALDVLGQDWGGAPGHATGSWDTLVKRVRRLDGTVLVSHEIFAPARPERIEQVMRDLAGPGAEVHVVYSARDLGRQLPAAWQESIKQGRKWTFRRFLTRVERGSTWFFHAFDLPNVLTKWSVGLPPERVHLVTVPRSAAVRADRDLLWRRMCEAFAIDPDWAPRDSPRANRSLGAAETEVIRQLNRRMDREARREARFDELIRQMLAQENLVNRDSIPVRLPPGRWDWAEEQAGSWIEWVKASGVQVVGDLDDLRPVRPDADAEWQHPGRVRNKLKLNAAVDALAAMTLEAARRDDPDRTPLARLRLGAERWRQRR
ncbi:MAG: hypothetical protein ABIQ15_18050 [Nocardioides sp.]